jgi:hypothetical protein
VARTVTTYILYEHCGFKTNPHAGSPKTFLSTFEGKPSWQGRVVVGAKQKITSLVEFYVKFVDSKQRSRAVVCRWDEIKETRNLEQHEFDTNAKLSEMIDFYDRHIAFGDKLQGEDLEFYQLFRAIQAFRMQGSTVPVAITTPVPATAGHVPIGVATRPSLSYAQAVTVASKASSGGYRTYYIFSCPFVLSDSSGYFDAG